MRFNLYSVLVGALCFLALDVSANTFYLVRHAEKQPGGADPALSECGEARAQALAVYLADVKLEAIYATGYQRTQQTAAEVAQNQQLKVSFYDPHDTDTLLRQLASHLQPVLIVGHSNTVPPLVAELSGIEVAALDEQNYSMLYKVELNAENPSVTLIRQAFNCNAIKESQQ